VHRAVVWDSDRTGLRSVDDACSDEMNRYMAVRMFSIRTKVDYDNYV
jgi:hypothetical protein